MIKCCWCAEAWTPFPGCIFGKKLSQTRNCWSWWHRLEPLWSAWAESLVKTQQKGGVSTWVGVSCSPVLRYLQPLPANRAAMPSCVTILYITLMVELESCPDTGNKEQTANVTAHHIHRQFKWVLSWLHFFASCSPSSTCLLVLTTSNGNVTIDAIWKKRRNVYSFHYITFWHVFGLKATK